MPKKKATRKPSSKTSKKPPRKPAATARVQIPATVKKPPAIQPETAEFVYKSGEERLESLLAAKEDLDKKASQLLTLMIPLLAAVLGFIFLKCDLNAYQCSTNTRAFIVAALVVMGWGGAIPVIVFGCLLPKHFYRKGNDPYNMVKNDALHLPVHLLKVASLDELQFSIDKNQEEIARLNWWLGRAMAMVAITPLAAIALTFIVF